MPTEQPFTPSPISEPLPAPASSRLPALGSKAVATVILAHLVVDLFPGYCAPMQRHLKEAWDLSLLETALLVIPGSVILLLQPIFGLLSDRMRTRAFVAAGLLASAIGYGAALPLAASQPKSSGYLLALLGIWLGSLGVAAYHPQGAALSGGVARGGSGRKGVAMFVLMGTIGYAAGMMLPPLFDSYQSIHLTPLLALLALPMLALQLLVPRLRPKGEKLSLPPLGKSLLNLREEIRPVFKPLLLCWLMVVIRAVTLCTFSQFVSIHFKELHEYNPLTGALLIAGFFMIQAITGPIAAHLADKIGEKLILTLSFVLGGLLLGAALLVSSVGHPLSACALILCGGGIMGGTVPLNVAGGQRLLRRSAAVGSGIMIGLGWGIGSLLVPLMAGIGDIFGGSSTVTLAVATAWALPGAALALLAPTHRDKTD
jgi:MFS transporter, FSR family, fosmidomycin resistance protein